MIINEALLILIFSFYFIAPCLSLMLSCNWFGRLLSKRIMSNMGTQVLNLCTGVQKMNIWGLHLQNQQYFREKMRNLLMRMAEIFKFCGI